MITSEEDPPSYPSQALPIRNPCLSFWQRTTRAFSLLNSNRRTLVPSASKYVIIGSGISGALTAFELIEGGVKGEEVVILEAGEAASGASSRNAGHVRPDAFRGFTAYSKVHGPAQALKILANEKLVLDRVDAFVRKYGISADFNLTTTFDVCMTPEFAVYESESLEAYKKAGGDISHIKFYEGVEAKKKTRVPGALAAYEWPAGPSHPAKLAHWLLSAVVSRGAKLYTHCPATKVTKLDEDILSRWSVTTPRGDITTSTIIHCTNAHTGLLLPHLAPYIKPNRTQAHTVIPSASFTGSEILTSTFSLRYGLHHFYSLIQRVSDGTMVLGVSRSNPTLSAETLAGIVSIDDSSYNKEICEDALRSLSKLFSDIEEDEDIKDKIHGEGLHHAWMGVIAMTPDSVPFVGSIETLPGQWICAGFNSHGMARIFTCAPGVAKLVLGGIWDDTGLPDCFQMTEERLKRISAEKQTSVW